MSISSHHSFPTRTWMKYLPKCHYSSVAVETNHSRRVSMKHFSDQIWRKKKKLPLICKKVCTLAWGDIRLLWISVNAQNIWYKTHLPNKLWRSQQFGNPCFNSYCIFMIYFQFAALSRIFSLFLKILAHPLNRMFDSVCTQSLSKCRSAS